MDEFLRFLPAVLFQAMGCGMILRAGRLEASGALVESKRTVRRGGWLASIGSLVAAVGAAALAHGAPRPRAAAAIALLASGGSALLAGLSGKPRPTGYAAAVLLVAGVLAAAWAAVGGSAGASPLLP